MTYHYGRYWAEIRPVHSQRDDGGIRYWHYKIYEALDNQYLFDGHDADLPSARQTVEAHIDRLMNEDSRHPLAA